MKSFQGVDFLNLQDLLSDEEKQIQRRVRQFVDDEFLDRVAENYQEGRFPMEVIPRLGEMGVLGCNLEGYGCAGLSPREYGLIMSELERGDSGLRSFASVQTSLCMYPIHRFGTEDQKQKYLPSMAKGTLIGCFGLTEPDFGSDPGGMLARAEKTAKGYRLSGTKRWITNGTLAHLAIVWAKLENKVRGFLIPTDTPGFLAKDIPGKLSLRASVTSEFVMDHCEVDEDALLPETVGLKSALECLSAARYGIVWGALGAAQACYEEALEFAQERTSFGSPLAKKQLVQSKLVWMLTEITKGQVLAFRLATLKEKEQLKHYQVSMGKMNNVGMALEVCRVARDILGANGISTEYQTMRHMCNLESVNTYEGTFDIHKLIIGKQITGIDALSGL